MDPEILMLILMLCSQMSSEVYDSISIFLINCKAGMLNYIHS